MPFLLPCNKTFDESSLVGYHTFSFVWIAISAHRVARQFVESHFEITFDDQVFVLSFNSSVYQQSKHFSLSCLHCLSMMDLFEFSLGSSG